MILREARRIYREGLRFLYEEVERDNLFYWAAEEILGKKRVDIAASMPCGLTEMQQERFSAVLARLKEGEPVQYIFGRAYFSGMALEVNPSVLIPRGETEELVRWAMEFLAGREKGVVLDLCTGSGAIALALAHAFPEIAVHACDISEEALRTARANGHRCGAEVDFFRQDVLLEDLPEDIGGEGFFDLIISNPPYVRPCEKARMCANVLRYEPHIALFANEEDPLTFYRRIACIAVRSLKAGGWLLAEINEAFPEENKHILREAGFEAVEVREDIHGKARMLRGIKPPVEKQEYLPYL